MTNKFNLLLVDDSPIITSNLSELLIDLENVEQIDLASSVEMAKFVISENETDVAILDIQLPDGNGIELLQWIKKEFPTVTVIIFSSHSDDAHRTAAKEYGAAFFFDKANEIEELINTISTIHIGKKSVCNQNNYNH